MVNTRFSFGRFVGTFALVTLIAEGLSAQQHCPATASGPLPLKYQGGPTVAAITACDLMARLYIFADDSMLGREVGTPAHLRATAYIEHEVRALGLKPAGDSGGYFQNIPVTARTFDSASTITVAGSIFHGATDFVAATSGRVHQLVDVGVVFAGSILDTTNIPALDKTLGKLLVFLPPPPGTDEAAIEATPVFQRWYQMYLSGAGRVIVVGPSLPAPMVQAAVTGSELTFENSEAPIELIATVNVAEAMLGASLGSVAKGAAGQPASTALRFRSEPRPGRNVVAILPGSDASLRGEYVAIGAHNDHIGVADASVDHDSLKVFNALAQPQGADAGGAHSPTLEEWSTIRHAVDSLHRIHGGARPDSIYNGADDDGSGTVSVLEIAEAFVKGATKPKRSLLFIWHAGEEKGLWGSEYFTDHPTVPRDSIVAELNLDMVGRGQPADVTGTTKSGDLIHGAANYLQIIGSRRLSTELGDLVEQVNKERGLGVTFDYALDADGHPENIYCRSDHAEYARYGIPIAFFTTGGHADYHQVTDEAEYIQYRHMAVVDELVFDIALKVAGLDHRVVVDHPKPDPHGACQQ